MTGEPPFSPSHFRSCGISGVTVVQRTRFEDSRGFLSRLYAADGFRAAGLQNRWCSMNHTLHAGSVRSGACTFSGLRWLKPKS